MYHLSLSYHLKLCIYDIIAFLWCTECFSSSVVILWGWLQLRKLWEVNLKLTQMQHRMPNDLFSITAVAGLEQHNQYNIGPRLIVI